MTRYASLAGALALALAVGVAAPAGARTAGQSTERTSPGKPDNTKLNRAEQATADQQKETKSDRELTRRIRRAITSDKNLSPDAHTVKIITQGGKVTLKGPVRSSEEAQTIEDKAAEVAGEGNVTSDLQIAPKNKKS